VNWNGRSKFITILSKSIWKRWDPKNPHLKPQHVNISSSSKCDGCRVLFHCWRLLNYYVSEDHPAIEDVIFIRKTKFPSKVLFWLAVSEHGLSEPLFSSPKMCISNCLPVVYKFLIKNIVLWPDLASTHYAKDTLHPIGRAKNWISPKRKRSTKRHTSKADRKFPG
jgi:hypothetical protein